MTQRNIFIASSILLFASGFARADQGIINAAGGSAPLNGSVFTTFTSTSTTPGGTLTINFTASPNTITFASADGTESLNGIFIGGGGAQYCNSKGRYYVCGYYITGTFTGTLTTNGVTQAVVGNTQGSWGTSGVPSAYTTYNSAYTPFYFSNSGQIIRMDNINGTNAIAYGSQGAGAGQFYGANGIALDSTGRIYVADTYNSRVVRIDDMNGTNWTSFGTYGSGPGFFHDPTGIAIDPQGRIYVADSGNNCLVRMDDMNGTNWTTFCSVGAGTNQLSSFAAVTVDSAGHIYVPDTGNNRVVRMDDMSGANWTTLSIAGITQSPFAVAVDAAGKIYIGVGSNGVVRVNDMTGANLVSITNGSLAAGALPFHSMNVDPSGMVLFGGYGLGIFDEMLSMITSPNQPSNYGSYYVWGITPIPLPAVRPPAMTISTTALAYANQNINTSSASQSVSITNFGGSPLNFSGIAATGGFVQTNNCPSNLIAGSTCTINVSFAPTAAGAASGTLTLSDNSGNMGSTQTVSLTGLATQPLAFVTPSSLVFPAQALNKTSSAQTVTVQNTGTGVLQIASVSLAAPFAQSNNCSAGVAPGAACTVSVTFTPTAVGSVTGSLAVTTNAGVQSVSLAGSGSSAAPAAVTVSPAALLFPPQLVGSTSGALTVTVSNTGKTSVTNKAPTITGNFSQTTNCSTSIAAGKSCTVSVKFAPTAAGARTGVLTLNLATGAQTVSLAGTGSNGSLPSALTLAPSSVSFTNGYIVGDNPSQTVTVTNASGASVGIQSIAISGDPSLTESTKCAAVLTPGASCTISVRFVPTVAGTFNSNLRVTEASGAIDTVPVFATAVAGGGGDE